MASINTISSLNPVMLSFELILKICKNKDNLSFIVVFVAVVYDAVSVVLCFDCGADRGMFVMV